MPSVPGALRAAHPRHLHDLGWSPPPAAASVAARRVQLLRSPAAAAVWQVPLWMCGWVVPHMRDGLRGQRQCSQRQVFLWVMCGALLCYPASGGHNAVGQWYCGALLLLSGPSGDLVAWLCCAAGLRLAVQGLQSCCVVVTGAIRCRGGVVVGGQY